MKLQSLPAFCLTVVLCSGASAQDKAPSKPECFDAHERAQVSQKGEKLRAAKQSYGVCAHTACPKLVRAECEAELTRLAKAIPSVVIATFDRGKPSSGLEVTIDSAPAEATSGSVELDPGEHLFRAATSDGRSVEKRVTLSAGQRDVEVRLEVPAPTAPTAPVEPAPAPAAQRKLSPVIWVLGGVAVVGLGGFVGFGLSGRSQESDLDACKPSCRSSDVDSMRRSYLFADLSLGVALVAAGVGGYLYVKDKKRPAEQGMFVGAAADRHGMGARVGASF